MTEHAVRQTPTKVVCASCGTELPPTAKFCPACGAPIAPRSDERRIVTVLFADVVGFTPYSEDRDPEHVKNLLDRCFDRLAADVASHGGRVDKIVGDEIMAVFGAPVAHEDDPERAVRAALQMQRTLTDHAEETGADVRMRIGVNTGEVVVGALRAGGDVTALGDVVNIAKRLQTVAEPGHVYVGPLTHVSTKDVIRYDPVGSLEVKGREAPVEGWLALEPLGPPGWRPRGARRPLVGRKAELGMLWQALGTAVTHRRPHFVLLVGDAGVGKTMLVSEAVDLARTEHDALVIEGRCLPYGEANPWWPVAESLRQACDIEPDDPADVAATKCREAVAGVLGPEGEGAEASRVADGLLYLMGYEASLPEVEPSRAREEAVRSIQMSLAANARRRPLVIVLSEIHWADQLVLDLIDTMFDRLRNLPIVLLATARPELQERWMPKPGRHNLFVLNLDALGPHEAAKLARSLLPEDASDELVDLIVERSGGNPLFIDELAKLLCDTTGLSRDSHIDVSDLPATLRGLVAARLDSLDRGERSLVDDAAVVGRSGPVEALEVLADVRGESLGTARLSSLADKDLIVVEHGQYEFKSDLLRDVAYETLTKGERARRHAAVAKWLGDYAQRTEREDEHLERIAHHYAQAAQLVADVGVVDGVPPDVHSQALDWLDRAASRAESRETTAVSVHLLEHALTLVGDDQPDQRARFLLGRARGEATLRDMDGAHADIDAALRIAETLQDTGLRSQALNVRGDVLQREGDLDRAAETLEEAVRLWRELGDGRGEAEALRLWGFTSLHRGELHAADRAISDALEISRKLRDRRGEAWALQNLAWVAFVRGDNDLAEQRLLASSNLFEEIGDFGGRTWAQGLLGYVWFFKGRLTDAGVVAEGGIEITRETGDRWAYGMMLNLLAGVRLWQGRTREALEHSTQAHKLFVEMQDTVGLGMSVLQRGWALILTGQPEEAFALFDAPFSGKAAEGPAAFPLAIATFRTIVGEGEAAVKFLDDFGVGDDAADPDLVSMRALALLVAGRIDGAYACASRAWGLDPRDAGSRANAACIYALAAAAAGHPQEAIELGDEVGRIGGTYLDQVRAHLARHLGYSRQGATEEAATALDSARRIAETTEDLVTRALVQFVEGFNGGIGGGRGSPFRDAGRRLVDLGVDPTPWERIMMLSVGLETD